MFTPEPINPNWTWAERRPYVMCFDINAGECPHEGKPHTKQNGVFDWATPLGTLTHLQTNGYEDFSLADTLLLFGYQYDEANDEWYLDGKPVGRLLTNPYEPLTPRDPPRQDEELRYNGISAVSMQTTIGDDDDSYFADTIADDINGVAPYELPSRRETFLMQGDEYRQKCSLPVRMVWNLNDDGKRFLYCIWAPPNFNIQALRHHLTEQAKQDPNSVPTADEIRARPRGRDARRKLAILQEMVGRDWLNYFYPADQLPHLAQRRRIDAMLDQLEQDNHRTAFIAQDNDERWHKQRQSNKSSMADQYAGPEALGEDLADGGMGYFYSEDERYSDRNGTWVRYANIADNQWYDQANHDPVAQHLVSLGEDPQH